MHHFLVYFVHYVIARLAFGSLSRAGGPLLIAAALIAAVAVTWLWRRRTRR